MKTTVQDILRLQSLQTGRLIAGQQGSSCHVSGATILELTEMGSGGGEELLEGSLKKNEILITALYNIRNNVEDQCTAIRTMNRLKASGLIVFYYGFVVKEFDRKVVELCNELEFPLIVIDYDERVSVAYADVLNDIQALVRGEGDEMLHAAINSMIQLQQNGGSVKEALSQIVKNRHAEIVAVDVTSQRILCSTLSEKEEFEFENKEMRTLPLNMLRFELLAGETQYYGQRYYSGYLELSLVLITSKGERKVPVEFMFSCMSFCINLWRLNLIFTKGDSLINSIVQKEWKRAHRELMFYRQEESMPWHFIMYDTSKSSCALIQNVKETLQREGVPYVEGKKENLSIIIYNQYADVNSNSIDPLFHLDLPLEDGKLVYASNVSDEHELFQMICDTVEEWAFICDLFRSRSLLGRFELMEAVACKRDCDKEEAHEQTRRILKPLIDYDKQRDGLLIETLSTFLIDANRSFKDVAELTHIHPNTAQYRIRKAESLLGTDFNQTAAVHVVYHAVCVYRMMEG